MSCLHTLLSCGEKDCAKQLSRAVPVTLYIYSVKYPLSCFNNGPKHMSIPRNKELFKLCLSWTNAVLRQFLSPASNKAVLAQYSTQILA